MVKLNQGPLQGHLNVGFCPKTNRALEVIMSTRNIPYDVFSDYGRYTEYCMKEGIELLTPRKWIEAMASIRKQEFDRALVGA